MIAPDVVELSSAPTMKRPSTMIAKAPAVLNSKGALRGIATYWPCSRTPRQRIQLAPVAKLPQVLRKRSCAGRLLTEEGSGDEQETED